MIEEAIRRAVDSDSRLPMPEGAPVFSLDARQSKQVTRAVRDGCAEWLKKFNREKQENVERAEKLAARHDELDVAEREAWGDSSRDEPKYPEKWKKVSDDLDKNSRARLSQHDVIDGLDRRLNRYLEWRIEERLAWARARAEGRL